MGDIVPILKGDAGHRELEGYAEIKLVLNYLGKGLYFVACVFVNDRKQEVAYRLHNIDEKWPAETAEGAKNE